MKVNVVIPAAGEATRLRPLTNNCSKAMVRIHGKPAISYIIGAITKSNVSVNEIVIVDGKHDDIREWVLWEESKNANTTRTIKCVKQGSLNGPRDAITVGINNLSEPALPLVVWLGDAIILDENLELGTDFLLVKQVDDHFSWCMYDGENFYNKPTESVQNATALVGLYSFSEGLNAKGAFNQTSDYDISAALEIYASNVNKFKTVHAKAWYDIGDISSYHRTCAEFLTFKARAFNSFEYDADLNVVTKIPTGTNSFAASTILNEKQWYESLDSKQQMFVPKLLDNSYGLSLSYESGVLLSDLFMHENISKTTIDYLIEKVVLSIRKYFHERANLEFAVDFSKDAEQMWISKTEQRLASTNLSGHAKQYYTTVAEQCMKAAKPVKAMHGDLHFGNIIYNPYNDSIKLIDPRGEYGSHKGCGGDHMYDLCKLSHDLYHNYNGMISGHNYPTYVKESFTKIINKYYTNYECSSVISGGALLIATCIPLHYDNPDRQLRMSKYVEAYAGRRY